MKVGGMKTGRSLSPSESFPDSEEEEEASTFEMGSIVTGRRCRRVAAMLCRASGRETKVAGEEKSEGKIA